MSFEHLKLAIPLGLCLAVSAACGSSTDGATPTTTTTTAATVGPEGGSLAVGPFALEVPAGALTAPVEIRLTLLAEAPPAGYHAYSPVVRLEPDGLQLAKPAVLSATLTAPASAPAVFLSRPVGPSYEWLGGTVVGDAIRAPISHFSTAFAGQGDSYVDPPDQSCTVTRLLEGRTLEPSAVALFVTVDDCLGAPITDLDAAAFALEEDGAALTSESVVTVLPREGVRVFVTLLLDMSSSVSGHLDELVAAAKAFLVQLQAASELPVHVAIQLFSGPEEPELWQEFWLVPDDVVARLDALHDYVSPDPGSTNLRGALIRALDHSADAQLAFRTRNRGGAFTSGYVVVFTDGVDTAAWVSEDDVAERIGRTTDTVVAVGLETADFDRDALARVAPGGTFTADDSGGLTTAFGALANRIRGQIARTYLIGYCSPKKAGDHAVTVRITDSATVDAAAYGFSASGFGPGCDAALFASACDGRACAGLGCGACDERTSECGAAGACLTYCTTACWAPGTNPNPMGYPQDCSEECDRDGIPLPEDICPLHTNPNQEDYDGDHAGDPCDDDDDGDGVDDEADGCPRGASGWVSGPLTDDDGDGCLDASDEDDDDDGDGVLDPDDGCPRGEVGWVSDVAVNDHDGDGCRDAGEDEDDDGDGVSDASDGCPLGPLGWSSGEQTDYDGDGCDDATADDDDDGDGVPDLDDACGRGPVGWISGPTTDPDGDGCDATVDPDNDDDGLDDTLDGCTTGAAHWVRGPATDYDGDGCRDADEDLDDDGDGVSDTVDDCPTGMLGWTSAPANDPDGDGCRDSDEDDDDGDGLFNAFDPCPAGLSVGPDHDGDGCNDAEEDDDDGDGVSDAADDCPTGMLGWTSAPANDPDGDGCRDSDEDDDDGDGVFNAYDACSDTLAMTTDHDGDGCDDSVDEDDDDDGVADLVDGCPFGAVGWVSDAQSDPGGTGCAPGASDVDGDGLPDDQDRCSTGACACGSPTGWCAAEVRYLAGYGAPSQPLSPNWGAIHALATNGAVCSLTRQPQRVMYRWNSDGTLAFARAIAADVVPVDVPVTLLALATGTCAVAWGSKLVMVDYHGVMWAETIAATGTVTVAALADDAQLSRVAWVGSVNAVATAIVMTSLGERLMTDERPGAPWRLATFAADGDLVVGSDERVARLAPDGSGGWERAFTAACGGVDEVFAGVDGGVIIANPRMHGAITATGALTLTCTDPPPCASLAHGPFAIDVGCYLSLPSPFGTALRVCGADTPTGGDTVPIRSGDFTEIYPFDAVGRPDGFEVLVALDREGVATVPAVIRYAPCATACDDGDLCTDDGPAAPPCSHTANDAPMCAAP